MHRSTTRVGLLAATLLTAAALPAHAVFVANGSGLVLPHQTLDFEGLALVQNQPVSTEFQAFGVTFANAFANPNPGAGFPNIAGNRLGNFQPGITVRGPLVMDFSSVLGGVAVALVSAPGTTTIQALLNGVLVETGSAATSTSNNTNYLGFTGIQFNRLLLTVDSSDHAFLMDNLQTAAVPEPAGWVLMLLGAAGLAVLRRPAGRPQR